MNQEDIAEEGNESYKTYFRKEGDKLSCLVANNVTSIAHAIHLVKTSFNVNRVLVSIAGGMKINPKHSPKEVA